jgi:diguanylate cyclase
MSTQCESSEVRQVTPASQPAAPSRWRAHTPVIAAALIGLVWSGFASYFVWKWEAGVARQELESAVAGHFLALQNGLNEHLNKLIALRTFFEASEDVSREEFETFGTRLLQGQRAVQNFSWVPLVSRAERARHEHLARWEGIPKYEIKALTVDDKIIPSPERIEYLPIYYSTFERGARVYGIDLMSQPIIRNRLEPARDNNQLSAVPEFYLHSRDGAVHGFLFSLPVYRRDMAIDTVEQRRAHLIGFVHGAFQTSEAIEFILKTSTTQRGLDIYLYLADAAPDAAPLHVHSSRLRSSPALPKSRQELRGVPHVSGILHAGDARWAMAAVPIPNGPIATRHDRAWLVLIASLLSSAGAVLYLRSSMRHAQRLMQANGEIMTLAQRDSLTGLFNRREFNTRLATLFADGRSGRAPFAVLYFDLDHFKDVNDTLGHPTGDRLLKQVAERVQSVLRQSDVVARFGGDEFAIILTDADAATAMTLATRINDILAQPFTIGGNHVHITASIGIALCTAETATPETLIMHADVALYRAKEDGRNCARFHSADLDHDVHERVTIADDLRTAVKNGELRLYYQPQVELSTGRIIGIEALLRWQHPKRGLLAPSTFIGIAERTGHIVALGEWVFDEACRQMRVWTDRGIAPGFIAVNVSASQFRAGAHFERSIVSSLNRWQLDPGVVEVELTESVLMEVKQHHNDGLEQIRQLGLRIAIDDFGTGYSSLSYLTNYTVNRLKIAQELVFGVMKDSRNASVVRTAIRLADELGIECIAEGVENASQVKFLLAAGCRQGQGYHFSRPVDANRMTEALAERAGQWRRKPPRLELVAG